MLIYMQLFGFNTFKIGRIDLDNIKGTTRAMFRLIATKVTSYAKLIAFVFEVKTSEIKDTKSKT